MKNKILIIVAGLCFAFSGCANGPGTVKTIEQIAVEYAVVKVVGNNPTKAAGIIAVAQSVKQLAGGEGLQSVTAITQFVRQKIELSDWKPEDKYLASILLETIQNELLSRVGTGALDPDKLVVVKEFASWVEDGARLGSSTFPATPAHG